MQFARDGRAKAPQRRRRRRGRRQAGRIDAGQFEGALVPLRRPQREHPRRRRDAPIDEPFAGPAKDEEFLEPHEAPRPREALRIVVAQPAQFRERQHRMHRRAGFTVERGRGAVGAPRIRDRRAAPVHPRDDARERFAAFVDAEHAVHRARETDRADFVAA
jgi:hypothetical protein